MEKLRSLETPVYKEFLKQRLFGKSSLKAVMLENFPKRKENFKSFTYTHGCNNVKY